MITLLLLLAFLPVRKIGPFVPAPQHCMHHCDLDRGGRR